MAALTQWEILHNAMRGFATFIYGFQDRFIDNPDPMTTIYREQILRRLEANFEGYSRTHMALAALMQSADPDAVQLDDAFERELEHASARYEEAKQQWEALLSMSVPDERIIVPLPKPNEVTIPQFSGNYREYTAFRSAVLARVYYASYPVHTKIDIIVKALSGDAKEHIGDVRGQDEAELIRIWSCLEDTFHNRYLLQRSHMGAIYEQPEIRSESAVAYRAMINRINQNMHGLEQLGIPTGELDPAILEMVLRKLDGTGTQQWETTRDKERLPTIQSFTKFLEERIVVLMNTAIQTGRKDTKADSSDNASHSRGETKSHPRNGRQVNVENGKRTHEQQHGGGDAKRSRTNDEHTRHVSDGRPKAPLECLMECGFRRPHQLWLCRKFRALDLEKRNQLINRHKLCRRCITLKHSIDACKSPRCEDCTDDVHNQVLCPKQMVIAKINTARASGGGRRRQRGGKNPFAKSE